MTSPSMLAKLERMRRAAPHELPKVRLCANVINAALSGGSQQAVTEAIELLQAGVGRSWSIMQALQFLSGRQAEFAIDCAATDEKPLLYTIHLVAKSVCNENGLSAVENVDGVDLAALRALAHAS